MPANNRAVFVFQHQLWMAWRHDESKGLFRGRNIWLPTGARHSCYPRNLIASGNPFLVCFTDAAAI
jgi:hypothetical protein